MKNFIVSKVAVLKFAMLLQTELHLSFFIFAKAVINLTKFLGGCAHNLYSQQISLHPVNKKIFKGSTKNAKKGLNLVQS